MRKYFSSKQQQQQAAAAAASKQQQAAANKQATELISSYLHISVIIDGTSPKLLWWIALVKVYKPTKFRVKTHQGVGSVSNKQQHDPECKRDSLCLP